MRGENAYEMKGARGVNILRDISIDEEVDHIMISTGTDSEAPCTFDVQNVQIKARVRSWSGQMENKTVRQLSRDYVRAQRIRLLERQPDATVREDDHSDSDTEGEAQSKEATTDGAQADHPTVDETRFANCGRGTRLG
jgi:hypothetical protein